MVKVSELRIGGLFLYEGDVIEVKSYLQESNSTGTVIAYIESIDIPNERRKPVSLEMLIPIPLTPEWLERMGCEVQAWEGEDAALVDLPGLFIAMPLYQKEHSFSISVAPKARRLRFVHEFQNYHQALTGEELEIKLS